jgi:pyruvate dehydrogenase E2 component (dihydrolipoamide acetyltransferase)
MNRFCVIALIGALAQMQHAEAFGIVSMPNAPVTSGSSSSTTSLYAGSEVFMPALSSTMKEGKVVTWLKSEGDEIEAGEAIMVVESDKADMDVEAFEDGYLAKILVDEGEMAPVGDAVALIAGSEDEIEEVANGAGSAPAAAAEAAPAAEAAAPATGMFYHWCPFQTSHQYSVV